MKIFSLTLSFFLSSLYCFAQYTITGRIIGQADTKPVAGANVFLSNTTLGTHTAADGSFAITNVKPGEYQLTVTNLGFDAASGDQTLTAEQIDKSGFTRLYDVIRAKANGIIFTTSHKLRSERTNLPFLTGVKVDYMMVVIDGTPLLNDTAQLTSAHSNVLDEIDAAEVDNVEIFLGAHGSAIYGSRASGGIVIVTTKQARKINNYYKESPGVITFKLNGFYKQREFYSPGYEHDTGTAAKPDLRTTIYWNPEFITDKDGNAVISYYNADGKGTYRVEIEGIDAEGNLGRQVLKYKVE